MFRKIFACYKVAKYDYNSIVLPVFVEKIGELLPAHAYNYNGTQINSSNKTFSYHVENEEYPIDLFNAELIVKGTLLLN